MHLFIFIGPSAAGKTTVMEALLTDPDLNLVRFPTTTTRDPRPGEVHGVHYQFLSEAEFRAQITDQQFFEWTEIYGHLYGTNRATLESLFQGTRPIVCVLELEGARKIKQAMPEQVTVILIEASRETLLHRLHARHTDAADIMKRIERIDRELASYPESADIVIQNPEGDLPQTIETVKKVILQTIQNIKQC